jgi:hypothetical protein
VNEKILHVPGQEADSTACGKLFRIEKKKEYMGERGGGM